MKTITFYSYKGGVGRSMALANIAWRLAERGKRIGIMDLDLEAPGLSLMTDFVPKGQAGSVGGLSGFLNRPKEAIAENREKMDRRARGGVEAVPLAGMREYGRHTGIGPFCHWIVAEGFKYPGEIVFLPVGKTPLDLRNYFGPDHDPELIASVKQAFVDLKCEYLLIDSRTGLTATSSIASVFYPDQVIMVLGLNSQNIQGTQDALRAYKDRAGDIFYLLPSLIPYGEEKRKEQAFKTIRKMLSKFSMKEERLLLSLGLPYHPQLAVEDRPMLVKGTSNFLSERYEQLAKWLIAQNKEDPITCIARAKEFLSEGKADKALPLITPICLIPPFRDDIDALRLYAEACTKKGFTVEARVALDRLLTLEAEADKRAGGRGVPTIKSVLLYYELDKKDEISRSQKLPRLLKIKDEHRPDESNDELNRLYTAISESYLEDPTDIPGFLRFNQEVPRIKPDFAPAATSMAADIHASRGHRELAYQTFESAYDALIQARREGRAEDLDLAFLLRRWAELAASLRDFELADQKLIEAIGLFEGEEKVTTCLDRARMLSKASSEPRKAEIRYLEQVLSVEPDEAIVGVIKRLANLYEMEERIDDTLEMRRKLLRLEWWDRRDGIIRIDSLQKRKGWQLDEQDLEEARSWLKQDPDDMFTIITVADMYFARENTNEAISFVTKRATRDETRRKEYASLFVSWAESRWKNEDLVRKLLAALHAPAFGDAPTIYNAQSKLHIILGDWENALKAATMAVKTSPEDRRNYFVLEKIKLLERLGRWQDALALVEQEFKVRSHDVIWPIEAAKAYDRAGASQIDIDKEERNRLFTRALDILSDFEKATGPMQLHKILPLRYHILVERMGREDKARSDLQMVGSQTYTRNQMAAVRSLPDAEAMILISAKKWDEAIKQTNRMARYAHDEDRWREMLRRKADLLFTVNRYNDCLNVLERLGKDVVENSLDLQFMQLRSLEALRRQIEVRSTLDRIRDRLKPGDVEDLKLIDLSWTVRCELRQDNDTQKSLDRARDCVRWIDIRDVNAWSPQSQAAAALYHLTFGSAKEAERLLQRLSQIRYYFAWVAEFIHDLEVVSSIHGLNIDIETVVSRFPLS